MAYSPRPLNRVVTPDDYSPTPPYRHTYEDEPANPDTHSSYSRSSSYPQQMSSPPPFQCGPAVKVASYKPPPLGPGPPPAMPPPRESANGFEDSIDDLPSVPRSSDKPTPKARNTAQNNVQNRRGASPRPPPRKDPSAGPFSGKKNVLFNEGEAHLASKNFIESLQLGQTTTVILRLVSRGNNVEYRTVYANCITKDNSRVVVRAKNGHADILSSRAERPQSIMKFTNVVVQKATNTHTDAAVDLIFAEDSRAEVIPDSKIPHIEIFKDLEGPVNVLVAVTGVLKSEVSHAHTASYFSIADADNTPLFVNVASANFLLDALAVGHRYSFIGTLRNSDLIELHLEFPENVNIKKVSTEAAHYPKLFNSSSFTDGRLTTVTGRVVTEPEPVGGTDFCVYISDDVGELLAVKISPTHKQAFFVHALKVGSVYQFTGMADTSETTAVLRVEMPSVSVVVSAERAN